MCNHNYMDSEKHGSHSQQMEQVRGWFTGRLPDGWFTEEPDILIDREEITVIGRLPAVAAGTGPGRRRATGDTPAPGGKGTTGGEGFTGSEGAPGGEGTTGGQGITGSEAPPGASAADAGSGERSEAEAEAIALGRSRRFREETRDARIEIAREAERTFGRKVSWGVICENRKVMFTTLSVPVMTRLRQPERRVLDTLVDAGVARSRSDALAWCVRLVGEHEDSWLSDLREALRRVEQVRAEGPRT